MTLGSLFDGSGTAPLAAAMMGFTPVWASEIEPYPIAVTKAQFPHMKHLGSILDINGGEVTPVDIICGGSPCQDLSVAGSQKELTEGTRSNLFFEMIRVIREMREATDGQLPRFVIWENVPGAFSSNKGRDFLEVLRQYAALADPDVYVPEPERNGDRLVWKYAGSIVGHGWSLAWRTMDAQYWGVPQRRRRIYLVLDLGSERAGEILFERKGVCGDSETSGEAGQGAAADAERSAGRSDFTGLDGYNTEATGEVSITIRSGKTDQDHVGAVCYALDSTSSNSMKSANPHSGFHREEVVKTLDTNPDPTCNQGGNVIVQSASQPTDICYSIEGHIIDRETGQNGRGWSDEHFHTLNATDRNAVAYKQTSFGGYDEGVGTLRASGGDIGGGHGEPCGQ